MGFIEYTKNDISAEKELVRIYSDMVERLPEGNLIAKKRSGNIYYYRVQPGSVKQEYINIENRELVTAIRDRHYAAASLKILSENIRAQERMLRKYRGYSPDCIMLLLGKAYHSISSTDEKRNKKKTGGMKFRDDELIHRTTFGLMVRSKSEALIAEVLHDRGIDFRYEEALRLYDEYGFEVIKYPDFTINIGSSDAVYWEHLGLMRDENYRMMFYKKLELYYMNGILPGSNLIITCDSAAGAIDMGAILRIAEVLVK